MTLADMNDLDRIVALYDEARNKPMCTWTDNYPLREDAENDIRAHRCFVLRDEAGVVIAALSLEEDEVREQPFVTDKTSLSIEISRVVTAAAVRGKHLSRRLVEEVLAQLSQEGCQVVRLLVSRQNIPAWNNYLAAGFTPIGECDLYDTHWVACEKYLAKSE